MDQIHDKGFRSFLSNPTVFADLLSSFVNHPWSERIHPDALELVNAHFILPTFEKREADLIYKAHILDTPLEETVFFYCLMELQSSVDYSMPLRLFVYMASLWNYLLKNIPPETLSRSDFRLPPIIPVVLYNGKEPWTVPLEFASAYQGSPGLFKDYAINFKYQLIDVNRYSWEELTVIGNLMSAVFLVDQKGSSVQSEAYLEELLKKVQTVVPILRDLGIQEVSMFLHWMKGIVLERIENKEHELIEVIERHLGKIEEETEVRMFVSNFAVEFEQAIKQYDAGMLKLRSIEEKLTFAEQGWAAAEQEKVLAEQGWVATEEKLTLAEQEKARAEGALRQAVLAMKELGIPLSIIAAKTGLPEEELAQYKE